MQKYIEMSAAKRNDPNYIQLNTDVRKEIGLKFKAICSLKELSLGEGLEQAIVLWIEKEKDVTL